MVIGYLFNTEYPNGYQFKRENYDNDMWKVGTYYYNHSTSEWLFKYNEGTWRIAQDVPAIYKTAVLLLLT